MVPSLTLRASSRTPCASSAMTPPVATNPQFTAHQVQTLLTQAWPSFAEDVTVHEIPVCVA